MEQNYPINTNAPQALKIFDWQKRNKEWFVNKIYCSNCGAKLNFEKFCPRCGFIIIQTQNPQPPEEG